MLRRCLCARRFAPLWTSPSELATSSFGELDAYWFREGTHTRLFESFGAHVVGKPARRVEFRVWAPNAASVAVIGDFNGWNPEG